MVTKRRPPNVPFCSEIEYHKILGDLKRNGCLPKPHLMIVNSRDYLRKRGYDPPYSHKIDKWCSSAVEKGTIDTKDTPRYWTTENKEELKSKGVSEIEIVKILSREMKMSSGNFIDTYKDLFSIETIKHFVAEIVYRKGQNGTYKNLYDVLGHFENLVDSFNCKDMTIDEVIERIIDDINPNFKQLINYDNQQLRIRSGDERFLFLANSPSKQSP